jgi:hypothetical protein
MHHEEYEKSLEVILHSSNKTYFQGNSLSNYTSLKPDSPMLKHELHKPNILLEVFLQNQYLNWNVPSNFIYVENYPVEFRDLLTQYEIDQIPYHGRGGFTGLYRDPKKILNARTKLGRQFSKFQLRPEIEKEITEEATCLENKKTLGIMLRYSNHYIQQRRFRKVNILKSAISAIEENIDYYDQIMVFTIVQPFLDAIIKKFGSKKVVFPNRERLGIDTDWGGSENTVEMSNLEYSIEYRNAFIDVYLASMTQKLLGGSSNMFLGALSLNPTLPFELFIKLDGK